VDNKENVNQTDINNPKSKIKVAVIDDDLFILEYMETILSQQGWDIKLFENGKTFIEEIKKYNPDLIFLDLMMPEINGFEVLQYLNHLHNDIPVIIMSALTDKSTILKVKNHNIKGYLAKPTSSALVIDKVNEVLNTSSINMNNF
jgi:DNA-binding response OmpR family regulator